MTIESAIGPPMLQLVRKLRFSAAKNVKTTGHGATVPPIR